MELAFEGYSLQVDVSNVPDATDSESFSAGGANGVGYGSSVLGEKNKVLLTGELADGDVEILILVRPELRAGF